VTDPFDRAFLERLLRADVAALADPAALAATGLEELAYTAHERAGLLRRVGEVPAELAAPLAEPRTVEASLEFLKDLALLDRLEAFFQAVTGEEPEDPGAAESVDRPEHVDEAETLFLHRDRVQAALGEVARSLPDTKKARSRLARVLANLARFDERWRANLHEFFAAIPLVERLKARFNWRALDRRTCWWWTEIQDAFRRVEAGGDLAELGREALEEDRCAAALEDVGWQRAAHATGVEFKGRRKFAAHLRRCPPCARAVADLESLFGAKTEKAPAAQLALAAAPTAETELEALRKRVFRPAAPIVGTPFSVAIGLKERNRLRFTFHPTGTSVYARELDGSEVAIEGIGRATVAGGAAEVGLPEGESLEEAVLSALRATRTLRLPESPLPLGAVGVVASFSVLGAIGALLAQKFGRGPIRLP